MEVLQSADVSNREAEQPERPILLPISHLAELRYCERNFYYRMVEMAEEANEHILQGRYEEERRSGRESISRESGLQTRNVVVHSDILGIAGTVDVMEEHDGLFAIVEYKKGALREHLHDDVQVCAQAMAWEDHCGSSMEYGYVYYHESRRRRKVWLSENLRELVIHTIERAFAILDDKRAPAPVADQRCVGCSVRERCMPDEVSTLLNRSSTRVSRPTPSANLARILYLQEPGLYIKKDSRRLIVTKDKQVISEIPVNTIDEIVSLTSVQWTSPAIQLLHEEGISIGFVTGSGRFSGMLQPAMSKNSLLRWRQYEFRSSSDRMILARQFAIGKLQNMRVMMMRHDRRHQEGGPELDGIEHALRMLKTSMTRDEILGFEGLGSKAYFQRFRAWVAEPFVFAGRVRRPPTDPVNALLSYGYSFLTTLVVSTIQTVGMDPYIGFLHESVYGRPALALDLMEEFRPIVVDSVVLRCLNQGMVSLNDFESRGHAVWLTDRGRRAFARAFDTRLKEELRHPIFSYDLTYRRLIELQVRLLAKTLTGEIPSYTPLKVR